MDFEIKLIEFLQAGRNQFFDTSFQLISMIGSVLGVIALSLVLLFFRRKLAFWYLLSYGFVYVVVNALKHFIERPRPFNVTDTILNLGDSVTGFAFPSGHAACATAIAIFLGYFLWQFFKKKSTRVCRVISCAIYVGLVCLSRMYLGKHYLTDVLAGVVISAIICVGGLLLMHLVQKKKKVKRNEN